MKYRRDFRAFHHRPDGKPGDNPYRSTHISASLPQLVQVAEPLTFSGSCVWAGAALSADCSGSSGNEQVITISASLPQFSHLQTCFTFFVSPLIAHLLVPLMYILSRFISISQQKK